MVNGSTGSSLAPRRISLIVCERKLMGSAMKMTLEARTPVHYTRAYQLKQEKSTPPSIKFPSLKLWLGKLGYFVLELFRKIPPAYTPFTRGLGGF